MSSLFVEVPVYQIQSFPNTKGYIARADPGIFVRGGPGQSNKKSSDIFFCFVFLVLSLFYRRQWSNKSIIFQGSRGGPSFSRGGGGGPTFSRGGPIAYSL